MSKTRRLSFVTCVSVKPASRISSILDTQCQYLFTTVHTRDYVNIIVESLEKQIVSAWDRGNPRLPYNALPMLT